MGNIGIVEMNGLRELERELKDLGTSQKEINQIFLANAQLSRDEIFERTTSGIDVNSNQFEYSEYELRIPVDTPGLKSLKPKGKDGKTKFKSGKALKTRFFLKGWQDVRKETGRNTDSDFFFFSGGMWSSIKAKKSKLGAIILSDRSAERKKLSGNNERFNFFGLNNAEEKNFIRRTSKSLNELVKRKVK